MPLKLNPPPGTAFDLAKGLEAAQRVFDAHSTKPEIAIFGYEVDQSFRQAHRSDPPTAEERRLSDVFDLAVSSAFEACTGVPNPQGWTVGVSAPGDVFFLAPGASLEAHQRGVDAARAVFQRTGITPQEAAMGDWEQQVSQIRGHEGPTPGAQACLGAKAFYDAQLAAREAAGDIPGSYLRVEGCDAPQWRQYAAESAVLNWRGEEALPAT